LNNNDSWRRLAGVECGDTVKFQGEFIDNGKGGFLHWTQPDPKRLRPVGWLNLVKKDSVSDSDITHPEVVKSPSPKREHSAGRGPIESRPAAPVDDEWPETRGVGFRQIQTYGTTSLVIVTARRAATLARETKAGHAASAADNNSSLMPKQDRKSRIADWA